MHCLAVEVEDVTVHCWCLPLYPEKERICHRLRALEEVWLGLSRVVPAHMEDRGRERVTRVRMLVESSGTSVE